MDRKPYPTDVSDDEWHFLAPYLTLIAHDAPQRRYDLREVFNALRWIVRTGSPWRMLPTNFPAWERALVLEGRVQRLRGWKTMVVEGVLPIRALAVKEPEGASFAHVR